VWNWAFKQRDDFMDTKMFAGLGISQDKLQRSSMGLRHLTTLLQDKRSEIDSCDSLSKESEQELFENFGFEKGGLAYTISLFNYMGTIGQQKAKGDPENHGDPPAPETCKKAMLKLIDKEIATMKKFIEAFSDKEKNELEANTMSMALPDKIIIDKSLRYETTIERQFYRALHELIRLQSARKGNLPPAPIAIDVDISHDN
ncbi:MAG: hypothetical protein AB1442_14690, partial [Nitrospirota bacterium]